MGTEMASERTRAAAARKQLEESLARQAAELQILNARLQQSADQHAVEVNALRLAAQKPSEEQIRQVQRLQEDKSQLEGRLLAVQQEMAARVQQLEEFLMHRDQQLAEQVNQTALLAAKIQESEQARSTYEVQQVAQLREALQASEAQSTHIAHDARIRLEEMERTKQLLEDRITKVDRDLAMERGIAAQNEERIRQEVSRLCLENQALNLQLGSSRQEDDAKWAAVQEQMHLAAQEVERLRNEGQSLRQQLALSSEELDGQKKKNNELRDKNYKAMDALAAAEKALVESKKANSVLDASAARQVDLVRKEEESKVAHYQSVLSQTEELLNRLQSRVEAEEASWKVKTSAAESELAAAKEERDFWMDQCSQKELLDGRMESVEREKEHLSQVRKRNLFF